MSGYPFPGPRAPQNDPAINTALFQPSQFTISALTLGATTTVTTSAAHNYVVGQLIRLGIPKPYGAVQLDGALGLVTSLPSSTQVVVTINSAQNVDAFVASPTYSTTSPSIVAVGDNNSGVQSTTGRTGISTVIPGSFQSV